MPNHYILIMLGMIFVLMLVIFLIVCKRLSNVKKTQDKLMKIFGDEETAEAILHLQEDHEDMKKNIAILRGRCKALEDKQKACFDRINIVRYYSAGENEAKMSYSVGLSNDNEDGLIITGLHYRSGVNMYFKQIKEGVPDFPLSNEEKEAVGRNLVSKVKG